MIKIDSIESKLKDGVDFVFKKNKIYFIQTQKDQITNELDKLKLYVKTKFSCFYELIVRIISPVYFDGSLNSFLKENVNETKLSLNLGSGNSRVSKEVVNVDLIDYEPVDIVCDISNLPFKDNSVDVIINIAVLEHTRDYNKIIREMHRVLKVNGSIYVLFPFIQGFHASPYDYVRLTKEGIKESFKVFRDLKISCSGGPTSGFLWIFQEWVAMLFSFGNRRIYFVLYILIMILTFPVKYLDVIMKRYDFASNISSGFIVRAYK